MSVDGKAELLFWQFERARSALTLYRKNSIMDLYHVYGAGLDSRSKLRGIDFIFQDFVIYVSIEIS